MAQFIGYHIDRWNMKSVPVSTGSTKAEAQAVAIQRVLASCEVHGSIHVQQRDEVDAETFADLGAKLDEFFASKGIA